MARSGKVNIIDGLSSVRAVQRSKRGHSETKFRKTDLSLPAKKQANTTKEDVIQLPKAKIAQTTLPQKHDIICYQCEFAFTITGRLKDTICPKCRTNLEARDLIIENEWNGTIRTIGTVIIKSGAILAGATIIARNIELTAPISEAEITANTIELDNGANIQNCLLKVKKIVIKPNAEVGIAQEIRCDNLEIHGQLSGKVSVATTTIIKESGSFEGTLKSSYLIVETGAGLRGNICVTR